MPRCPLLRSALKTATAAYLALAISSAGVFADSGASKKAKAPPFLDPPAIAAFEVSSERGPDKNTWINVSAEVESVFRCPMRFVMDVLWDFETSPEVFKRIESVRVRSDDGKASVTEQKSAIRVLGFSFVTELIFENDMGMTGEHSAAFSFRTIGIDDKTRSTTGAWYMEEVSDSTGTSTRIRYSMNSIVISAFPGQEFIIRSFGEGDIKNVVRELAAAVESRLGG